MFKKVTYEEVKAINQKTSRLARNVLHLLQETNKAATSMPRHEDRVEAYRAIARRYLK